MLIMYKHSNGKGLLFDAEIFLRKNTLLLNTGSKRHAYIYPF